MKTHDSPEASNNYVKHELLSINGLNIAYREGGTEGNALCFSSTRSVRI
jgi:hypothetical protein